MLFISHSSKDVRVVEALVDLFRAALPLTPENIRCSSLDGYRLPGGADIDTHLRQEVPAAQAFVGVISHNSLRSTYVSFEFGARWGAGKALIPLLAPGVHSAVLHGPLGGLNALSCASAAQLHQLVADVARALSASAYGASAYQREVERIRELPPVPGEMVVPSSLAAELLLDWPTRWQRLSESQRGILDYLASETRRRGSVPQQDIEARFGSNVRSIYWRLEVLCCLGFTEKEITNFRGSTPTYNYRLSDEYRSSLENRR
jgi:hypothetical protein